MNKVLPVRNFLETSFIFILFRLVRARIVFPMTPVTRHCYTSTVPKISSKEPSSIYAKRYRPATKSDYWGRSAIYSPNRLKICIATFSPCIKSLFIWSLIAPRNGMRYSKLQLAQDDLHHAFLSHYAHSRKATPS